MTNVDDEKRKRDHGELRPLADGFAARIYVAKKDRREYVLESCGHDREKARARCTALATFARRMRKANLSAKEIDKLLRQAAPVREGRPFEKFAHAVTLMCDPSGTIHFDAIDVPKFRDFALEWTSGKLRKKFPDHVREKDSTRDEEILRLHINDEIGDLPIDLVDLHAVERVMASLPSTLAPRSRNKVAQCVRKILSLAVYPGRHIPSNPIPREWMPKISRSANKAKAWLYPEEDAKLIACEAIPIDRRMVYAILIREGMRASELETLRWRDVDLEKGRIRLDENKTDDPRAWVLSPDVAIALTWWKQQDTNEESDLVIARDLGDGAWWLRGDAHFDPSKKESTVNALGDLRRAGVTRPELFQRTSSRLPIRLHDLRASFVTIALANGRTEQWVTDRTGHRSSQMLATYARQARTWAELELGNLVSLTEGLPELRRAIEGGKFSPHELPHIWSRFRDLNSRPTVYESTTPPPKTRSLRNYRRTLSRNLTLTHVQTRPLPFRCLVTAYL